MTINGDGNQVVNKSKNVKQKILSKNEDNPKKRFFAVGMMLLSGGIGISPMSEKIINKYLDINIEPNPWISGIMILASLFMFWLDYRENRAS